MAEKCPKIAENSRKWPKLAIINANRTVEILDKSLNHLAGRRTQIKFKYSVLALAFKARNIERILSWNFSSDLLGRFVPKPPNLKTHFVAIAFWPQEVERVLGWN